MITDIVELILTVFLTAYYCYISSLILFPPCFLFISSFFFKIHDDLRNLHFIYIKKINYIGCARS